MTPEIAARLAALEIQTAAETREYFMLMRDNCVAMVHRTSAGYSVGGSGFMKEGGLYYLVWRDGAARFVGKAGETTAEPAQVELLRKFSGDVKTALFAPANR